MNAFGDALDRTTDPLLRPFQLKHLTLRNRVMSTRRTSRITAKTACRRTATGCITSRRPGAASR